MAGSVLRDHRRKAAFVARLVAAGRQLDDAGIAAVAEEMALSINQIWLWNDKAEAAEVLVPAPAQEQAVPTAEAEGHAEAAAFDPFAFSVIVLLKRQGAARLLQRLETITSAAQLRSIAEAQHIGIDKSITSVKLLREAIVTGAEQRLADRRAAAG